MPKSQSRRKKSPKRVLALPDLEQAKTAVLNSLTSVSGQRPYEHAIREFVAWGTVVVVVVLFVGESCSVLVPRPRSFLRSHPRL